MKSLNQLTIPAYLLLISVIASAQQQPSTSEKTDELNFHGTIVNDPYTWLEKTNKKTVKTWYEKQNQYTRSVLDSFPQRAEILKQIKEQAESLPFNISSLRLIDNRFFYLKRKKDEEVAKLYYRDCSKSEEKLIVDSQIFMANGKKNYTISGFYPSPDGKHVAVGFEPNGTEIPRIYIFDVEKTEPLSEYLKFAFAPSISWLPDSKSFIYRKFKLNVFNPNKSFETATIYHHTLGTPFKQDKAILSKEMYPDLATELPFWPYIDLSPQSPYMFLVNYGSVEKNISIYYAPDNKLLSAKINWKKIVDKSDGVTSYNAKGEDLYLLSHKDAPRYQLLKKNMSKPAEKAEVIIPESEEVLVSFALRENGIYADMLEGVYSKLYYHPYENLDKKIEIALPFEGILTWYGFDDVERDGLFFDYESYIQEPQLYYHDATKNNLINTNLKPFSTNQNEHENIAKLIFATANDGTKIPISIVHRKELKLDGSHPLLLYAYGAYGQTDYPNYEPIFNVLLEKGTIYAVAHVRGGGIYGDEWHRAALKETKQVTWNDFISCAEHLIGEGYTSSDKLVIWGASAGGITVGRAMTERPELFTGVISQVGVLNTLSFDKSPVEAANIPELGDINNPDDVEFILNMDSYHHLKKNVQYPAVFLTAGWNDRRVPAWQAGKMAAKMQNLSDNKKPVLLHVNFGSGHFMGTTSSQTHDLIADMTTFFFWQTGIIDATD
jgi:prolyl oligopeptidase